LPAQVLVLVWDARSSAVAEKWFRGEVAPQRRQALPIHVVSRGLTGFGRLTLMPVVVAERQIGRGIEERLLSPE
jgi:hypothetical protein